MIDPKLALAYAFTPHFEAYADVGESYHSNDARSVTGVVDPQTHRNFDPSGNPVYQNTPLDRAVGEEPRPTPHRAPDLLDEAIR